MRSNSQAQLLLLLLLLLVVESLLSRVVLLRRAEGTDAAAGLATAVTGSRLMLG